jgi:hypothetical protein
MEPTLDSLLAVPEDFAVGSIHSKWPFVGCCCFCNTCSSANTDISSFFFELGQKITLVEGPGRNGPRITRITRIDANRQLVMVVLPPVRSELALVIGGVEAGSGERRSARLPVC